MKHNAILEAHIFLFCVLLIKVPKNIFWDWVIWTLHSQSKIMIQFEIYFVVYKNNYNYRCQKITPFFLSVYIFLILYVSSPVLRQRQCIWFPNLVTRELLRVQITIDSRLANMNLDKILFLYLIFQFLQAILMVNLIEGCLLV